MADNPINSILRYIAQRWRIAATFLLFLLIPFYSFAQKDDDASGDEVTVLVEVKGIGNTEMPAIIRDKDIYMPVNIVFDFLKIKNIFSSSYDSLSGFYVNEKDIYLIDKAHNRLTFKDTIINISPGDLLKDENNLYLNLKYFKPVFGLEGVFNFRRLAVTFTSAVELPAIREERQELMRRNVSRLRGDLKADTAVDRTYPAFHFGAADWAVMSTQQTMGVSATTFNLGLGGIVAGGETDASLNYYTNQPLDEKQQYYQWHYVNNDNDVVKQVMAGTIYAQSISTLYAPVVGIQCTNASSTYRRSYGTYTLSNVTDPGWVVELYVNGVLVDYKKTDASGFYTFEVPLIYGYSVIKLRFYGPYGEQRTTQTYINVPFNFIPVHEFEYVASAGVVEDGSNSIFSRGSVNYGLSSKITIGGGVEYLSSVTSGNTMPFVDASIKLAPRLLLSGEYTYGVRKRAVLSYRLPTNLQLDVDYTKYVPGQTAIYYNYLQELKAVVSMPVHVSTMSLFSRLTIDQITVPNAKYTNAELTFTGAIKFVGLNFSNYASFVQTTSPYLYGLFSVSFPLPKKILFTSQLQYDYKAGKPVFMKYTFEKRLFGKGYLTASYQEFFNNNTNIEQSTGNYQNVLIGMRYDFSFARVAVSTLQDNNKGYSRVETASGSFIYDKKTDYFNVNNRTNVGKGDIAIEPFLDINCNGIRDPGEPRVPGLKVQINGGRIIYDEKDTVVRILDLEPYVKYYVELNKNSFDNIAWQIKNHIISVAASPNDFTVVEVPVAVVGEVSGTVVLKDKEGTEPKGERLMIVNIYDSLSHLAAHTITESDGFFSYIGLAPGGYTLQLDSVQLQKLHLKPKRSSLPIRIAQNMDGDIEDGIDFTLQPAARDTMGVNRSVNDTGVKGQTAEDIVIDTVNAIYKGKIIVKASPNNNGDTFVVNIPGSKKTRRTDTTMSVGKYSMDGPGYVELASQIYKFYSGTVVCVFNDSSDYIDIAQVSAKGTFLLYDFLSYRVTMPDPGSGIISRVIFVNDKMQVIESVNMRLVNGRNILRSNSREHGADRASVRISKNK